MAPQKITSASRFRGRANKLSFRDDSSLVALPYEQTVQAAAPRLQHSQSTVSLPLSISTSSFNRHRSPSTSTTTSTATSSAASINISSRLPFAPNTVIVAPPTEQHPAFRNSLTNSISSTTSTALDHDWKRDSGLAPNSSSATTIIEEDCEDDLSICDDDDFCVGGGGVALNDKPHFQHIEGPPPQTRNATATIAFARASLDTNATTPDAIAVAVANDLTISAPASPTFSLNPPSPFKKPNRIFWSGATAAAPPPFKKSNSDPNILVSKKNPPVTDQAAASTTSKPMSMPVSVPWGSPSPPSLPPRSSSTSDATNTTPIKSPSTSSKYEALRTPKSAHNLSTPPSPSSPTASSFRRFSRSKSAVNISQLPPSPSSTTSPKFAPISIDIHTDKIIDDDFMTTLTFSKRGSVMVRGKRPARLTKYQSNNNDATAAAAAAADDDDDNNKIMSVDAQVDASSSALSSPSKKVQHKDESMSDKNNAAVAPAVLEQLDEVAEEAPQLQQSTPPPSSPVLSSSSPSSPSKDSSHATPFVAPMIVIVPTGSEEESQKVRSLYESSDPISREDSRRISSFNDPLEPTPEDPSEDLDNDPANEASTSAIGTPRSGSSLSFSQDNGSMRRAHDNTLEDWHNVNPGDVDRYGFIIPRRPPSPKPPAELGSAQNSPRRRNVLVKRDPALGPGGPTRKMSARSLRTQHSAVSISSRKSTRSAFRQAGNMLPHNRDRRWMDEAGDMLNLAPGGPVDEAEDNRMLNLRKAKETERSEKWMKMAKVVHKGKEGQGMDFEFDTKSPKLIERTWKGIPDRWRAAAWYSFLRTSAREDSSLPDEDSIITEFHRLQTRHSPDDLQIHLDVPRTMGHHILFRRRHKGGQRLLFRVLHAISIYFPRTGYVQGMASLAATLLCYFDEEKAFVMLVRMWRLRGMEQLYQDKFQPLFAGLRELQIKWLRDKELAKKVADLGVEATAYGAKWYLTLFNLSIPFAAQLRVWDVFLLLGGTLPSPVHPDKAISRMAKSNSRSSAGSATGSAAMIEAPAGMDVLHATSTAIMDALQDVLIESDFENAMMTLTSWVPVKDEDHLMKVVRAEWRLHNNGRKR